MPNKELQQGGIEIPFNKNFRVGFVEERCKGIFNSRFSLNIENALLTGISPIVIPTNNNSIDQNKGQAECKSVRRTGIMGVQCWVWECEIIFVAEEIECR